jgi:hypothetical protein
MHGWNKHGFGELCANQRPPTGLSRPRWCQPTVDKPPEDALERPACRDRGQDRKSEDAYERRSYMSAESGFPGRRRFFDATKDALRTLR